MFETLAAHIYLLFGWKWQRFHINLYCERAHLPEIEYNVQLRLYFYRAFTLYSTVDSQIQ